MKTAARVNIEKALKQNGKKEFEKGVREAMSVAVNLFNCEERIRQGVFQHLISGYKCGDDLHIGK